MGVWFSFKRGNANALDLVLKINVISLFKGFFRVLLKMCDKKA